SAFGDAFQQRVQRAGLGMLDARPAQILGLAPGLRGSPYLDAAVLPAVNEGFQDTGALARAGYADQDRKAAIGSQRLDSLPISVSLTAGVGHAGSGNRGGNLLRCQRMPPIGDGGARQPDQFGLLITVQLRDDLDIAALNLFPEQLGPFAVLQHAAVRPMPGHGADVVGAFETTGGDKTTLYRHTRIALADHRPLSQHRRQVWQTFAVGMVHPLGPRAHGNR